MKYTIRYTVASHTWCQGVYLGREMADMNARLCNALGMVRAEVIPA